VRKHSPDPHIVDSGCVRRGSAGAWNIWLQPDSPSTRQSPFAWGWVHIRDRERLATFFDFPAEHWKHLRTTNAIESPFATVRLRERATRGSGSRTKGLLMAFKLLDMTQQRWRRLDGAHLLALVRGGTKFVDGVRQDRPPEVIQPSQTKPREAA